MSQQGINQWDIYKQDLPIVFAGRVINTNNDALRASFRFVHPVSVAGVRTSQGFVHQSSTPSPKAPAAASRPFTFTLQAEPQLDEDTHRHYEAMYSGAEYQLPKIWFNFPLQVTWGITTGRIRYSTPFFISGSAGEASVGQPRYFNPIVEVRQGGTLVETLDFVASSPSATEFTLDSTVTDTRAIIVGDQSANDGRQLHAWIFCLVEVMPVGLTEGFAGPGEWSDELPLISAVSTVPYEEDEEAP